MVTAAGSLDATFRALADPTRRAMLARLAVGEATVTELAEPFEVSLPAVSKHLRVLEGAGLLARERDGRRHRCRLLSGPLTGAAEWIDHYRRFWEAQLDALDRYVKKEEEPSWRRRPSGKRPRSISRGRSRPRGTRSSGRGRTRRS
jgi:DNA-binding transcriptional ArsR family regulator